MYAVTAEITLHPQCGPGEHVPGNWTLHRSVPTFYLDEHVQGIVSESHAREIAESVITAMVGPACQLVNGYRPEVHVTAVKVDRAAAGIGES